MNLNYYRIEPDNEKPFQLCLGLLDEPNFLDMLFSRHGAHLRQTSSFPIVILLFGEYVVNDYWVRADLLLRFHRTLDLYHELS